MCVVLRILPVVPMSVIDTSEPIQACVHEKAEKHNEEMVETQNMDTIFLLFILRKRDFSPKTSCHACKVTSLLLTRTLKSKFLEQP